VVEGKGEDPDRLRERNTEQYVQRETSGFSALGGRVGGGGSDILWSDMQLVVLA